METITIEDFKANTKEWLIDKLESMSKDDALQAICNIHDELHKPQYPKTCEECCEVKREDNIIFEFGAMSSRFRLQAENKFTAYAAMVLHFYSNPHLVALYEPEDLAKQDSWLMHTPVEPRLDEIFGGKGSFMKYLREHKEEIKEAFQNVEKII